MAPAMAPGRCQCTTFHSTRRHEMAIRAGLATRLARVKTGATCLTRIRWVTVANKITLPAPPLTVLIVQLTHPAENSRAGVCRLGIQLANINLTALARRT